MKQKKIPTILIVAGSDSGGGAGIQADIKAASYFKVFATTAVTAVTDAATRTSCDGKVILGKGGKCIFGGGFSSVCTSFVPSGLRKSLGGTTKG